MDYIKDKKMIPYHLKNFLKRHPIFPLSEIGARYGSIFLFFFIIFNIFWWLPYEETYYDWQLRLFLVIGLVALFVIGEFLIWLIEALTYKK